MGNWNVVSIKKKVQKVAENANHGVVGKLQKAERNFSKFGIKENEETFKVFCF